MPNSIKEDLVLIDTMELSRVKDNHQPTNYKQKSFHSKDWGRKTLQSILMFMYGQYCMQTEGCLLDPRLTFRNFVRPKSETSSARIRNLLSWPTTSYPQILKLLSLRYLLHLHPLEQVQMRTRHVQKQPCRDG